METSKPTYIKYDETNKEWVFIEVDDAAFTNQLRRLATDGATLGAKVGIFAATFAGSGGGVGVALAVDVFAAGAMYAIDGDKDALAMDLLFLPLGYVGEGMSIVKSAMKSGVFDKIGSGAYKGYAEAAKIVNKADILIYTGKNSPPISWSKVKSNVEKEGYTADDIDLLVDDLIEMAQTGKHVDLINCTINVGIAITGDTKNSGVRNTPGECKRLKAGKILSELRGPTKDWIRKSDDILDKLEGQSDDLINKVKNYYKNHQMPTSCTTRPNCSFQGNGFTVQFDDFGHPRFEPHVPRMSGGIGKINFNSPNLGPNSTSDIAAANKWAIENPMFANRVEQRGTNIAILDEYNNWVECIWHHHEDGFNMIPVPIHIHDKKLGGAGHTGGTSVIDKELKGFFNGLTW